MHSIPLTPPSHLPLLSSSSRGPTFLKPLNPSSSPSKTLLRFSLKPTPNNNPTTPNPILTTLFKPTLITLTATAALFLSNPSFAIQPQTPTPTPTIQPLQSETQEEEKILEDRLTANPDDIPTLRSLLELKSLTRKLPEAIALADRLTALHPHDPQFPLQKAHLQLLNNDTHSAKQAFEDILSKNPLLVEAYHGLVLSVSDDSLLEELKEIVVRVENAVKALEEEGKKDAVVDLKLLVVQIRIIEGKLVEALRLCKEVVEMEPEDFRPYMSQGIVYNLMGRRSEAVNMFRKFRQLAPRDHPYRQMLDNNLNPRMDLSEL